MISYYLILHSFGLYFYFFTCTFLTFSNCSLKILHLLFVMISNHYSIHLIFLHLNCLCCLYSCFCSNSLYLSSPHFFIIFICFILHVDQNLCGFSCLTVSFCCCYLLYLCVDFVSYP